jgi:Zn-dependent protease
VNETNLMPDIADALLYFVVFLLSTTLHEAAHAWAALRGGDPTAYHGGQVSLDPIPHIRREPFGMVILPLVSALLTGFPFGYASAPYDPQWARRHPTRAAWMALAGPAANLLLVITAGLLLRAGAMGGIFTPPESVSFGTVAVSEASAEWGVAAKFLSVVFSLNLLLAAFNMLPFPPLDGSGALPLLLPKRATSAYQDLMWGTPMLGFVGLFVAWKLFDFVFQPIFIAAINLLYPGVTYG